MELIMKKTYNTYTTSCGQKRVKIENKFAFRKYAQNNFGKNWVKNKQLIQTYSLEQLLLVSL